MGISLTSIVQWFESLEMVTVNLLWQITQWFISLASSFNLLTGSFGRSLDSTIGAIGGAITGGAPGTNGGPVILIILVIAGVGVALAVSLRQRNGALLLRRLVGIAIITALFTLMTGQASQADNSEATPYQPAAMSPVWVGTEVSGLVDKVTSGLSNVVASTAVGTTQLTAGDTSNLSCGALLQGMQVQLAASTKAQNLDASQASALNAVNALYVNTALSAYQVAQYGANVYGERVWCRGADFASPVSGGVSSIQRVVYAGASGFSSGSSASASNGGPGWLGTPSTDGGTYSSAAAFGNQSADSSTFDKEIIAWAACHPSIRAGATDSTDGASVEFHVDSGWSSIKGASISVDDCKTWWTSDGGSIPGNFSSISSWSASDVDKNIGDENVAQFVSALHGNDNGVLMEGLGITSIASFASVSNVVIIGGIALGNIIAKVLAMFLLFAIPFILLKAMFSAGQSSGHISNHLKAILGVMLFTVGMGIILALITLLSSLLSKAGSSIFGSGSLISILWTGLCPVLAVFGLHYLFKRLGLPSPVTLTGAASWGTMLTKGGAAAAGGAAAGGVAALAQQAGTRMGRGAAGSVRSAVTGRGAARRGSAAISGGTGVASAGGVNSSAAVGRRSSAMSQVRLERAKKAAQKKFESQQSGVTAARGGRLGAGARKIGAWAAQGAGKLGSAAGKTRLGQTAVGAAGHARTQAQYLARTRAGQAAARAGRTAAQVGQRAASVGRRVASTRAAQVAGRAALVGGASLLAGPVGLAASTAGVHASRHFTQRRAERKQAVADELERLNVGQKPAAEPAPGAERPQRIPSHHAGRRKKRA
ncbi:hypothetical protein [Microbacterium enclense]|uniref:hypothetical protein n=1 Tax=Microbacterium enclense TaxID=993073 RepID=UPI003F7E8541